MKDERVAPSLSFILHPSSFILFGRRSQVVRQRSAKPLFIGSIPIAASNPINNLQEAKTRSRGAGKILS